MDNIQIFTIAVVVVAVFTIGGGVALAISLYQANRLIIETVSAPRSDIVQDHGGHVSGLGETMRA
ncbi:MAG: hypothetical protein VX199_03535, partial [Chloroflexota bacterium]|nr:hypothetical protein [Chloroflexota bacterium]